MQNISSESKTSSLVGRVHLVSVGYGWAVACIVVWWPAMQSEPGRYINSVSDLYGADEIEVLLEEIRDLEPASCRPEDIQDFEIAGSQTGVATAGIDCESPAVTVRSWDSHANYRHQLPESSPTASLFSGVILYCDETHLKSSTGVVRVLLVILGYLCALEALLLSIITRRSALKYSPVDEDPSQVTLQERRDRELQPMGGSRFPSSTSLQLQVPPPNQLPSSQQHKQQKQQQKQERQQQQQQIQQKQQKQQKWPAVASASGPAPRGWPVDDVQPCSSKYPDPYMVA